MTKQKTTSVRKSTTARSSPARAPAARSETSAGLDKFGIHILGELQNDARLTNAELASRIGLSPAPCWRRVRRLEEEGYIKSYRAELDRRKIGLGVTAFVRLDAENTGQATQRLEQALAKLTQVISCHYISGAGTFELHVVATDLDAFSRFALQQLINLPGVKDIHTSFSLGEIKSQTAVPLDHLKTV